MVIESGGNKTPLDPDEIDGLKLSHITTRQELDMWEQDNILEAFNWIEKQNSKNLLIEKFILELHRRMFCNVWVWAGEYRKTNKNIGIEWWKIPVELRKLLEDAKCWISENTYEPYEMAVRFHYRLVSIHVFSNGNGRHARMMADIIIEKIYNKKPFTWGSKNLSKKGTARKKYLAALKKADQGDFEDLIRFARS
jgi:Fic-DOC domain mobile mystery protein B